MSRCDSVAVIGAGTMGHGIAQLCAQSQVTTTLYDVEANHLERAVALIEANLARAVSKGKLASEAAAAARARINTSTELADAVESVDLVIEAVPEKMQLKRELFAKLASLAPPTAVLATNTSSLSITEIAAATSEPARVLGMHFFNPPHALTLLELVKAEQTSEATLEAARAAGTRLGREMIVVGDWPGFATSRLGVVLGLEAIRMLQDGVASAEDIDRAMMLGYKHPMGPLRLTDLVGLDVRLAIAEYLHRELGGEQYRPPALLRRMVRAGKLGKKAGQGFFTW